MMGWMPMLQAYGLILDHLVRDVFEYGPPELALKYVLEVGHHLSRSVRSPEPPYYSTS
jgi:hypothetical protein